MTDIDMPNADAVNLAEAFDIMATADWPQTDSVPPTAFSNEETDAYTARFEALLEDDITPIVKTHTSSINPTQSPDNNEVDVPDVPTKFSPKPNPSSTPKFSVKKFIGIATWAPGDGIYDHCAICRNHVLDLCIDCEVAEVNGLSTSTEVFDACDYAEGLCRHMYHFHCVSKWLKTHSSCPMDNMEWSFLRADTGARQNP